MFQKIIISIALLLPFVVQAQQITLTYDANGNRLTKQINGTAPHASVIGDTLVCHGLTTTLHAHGGSTYLWSNGSTDSIITVLVDTPITYKVVVHSSNGCADSATHHISVAPLPVLTVTANPTTSTVCAGALVTLTAIGASTYSWSGGISNGVSFTPTATSTYTVTGTSTNGCVSTATKMVSVNPLPSLSITSNPSTPTVCSGLPVTLTANGASTYTWSGGITNGVAFTPTATTTYTVTGTSSNGCTKTATKTVTVNTSPILSISSIPLSGTVCNGNAVTLSASGANSYSWSGGISNGVTFIPSASTTYSVTGTNTNGCTATGSVSVIVNPNPVLSISSVPTSTTPCSGDSITLTATGANSYSWSGGINNGVVFVPTNTSTYNVTGTDANGCTATLSQLVTVNATPVISIVANPTNGIVCSGLPVTLTATGATFYNWTGGISNGVSFNPSSTNTYTVTGISNLGCSKTDSFTVHVNPNPTVQANITPNDTICSGTQVTLFGTGNASTYSWNWGIVNNVAFYPPVSATYVVTGTDANNCTNSDSIHIQINPNITPTISLTSWPTQGSTGDPITYTATTNVPNPYTIDWYRNSILSATTSTNTWNDFIVAGNNQIYAVIKNPTVCITPDSATSAIHDVHNVTGISEVLPDGFSIYPNPATSELNIVGLKPNDEFKIINNLGQVILKDKNFQSSSKNIKVDALANGIYSIILIRNDKQWIARFEKMD